MNGVFLLKGGETLITHQKDDAWHIKSGNVLVYIVPWKNNVAGRRAFLYEAKEGQAIPSLCFRDYEYNEWRFCFVAVDTAEISVIHGGNTAVLRSRFAQKTKMQNIERESFDESAVDYYKMTLVAEDGLIHKTIQDQKTTSENTLKIIYNVFNRRQIKIKTKKAGNKLYDAVSVICANSGITIAPLEKIQGACPDGFNISDIARISHFAYREIVLDENWYKSDSGALLAFDESGDPVACIPKGQNKYTAYFVNDGDAKPISKKLAMKLNPKAYALYRPFVSKSMGTKGLIEYCIKSFNKADILQIVLFTALCTAIGLLLPLINQLLYDTMIPLGASKAVMQLGFVIGSAMIGNVCFSITKNLLNFRASSRIGADINCAVQDRLFNLPERFIRKYESADLAQRVFGLSKVAEAAVDVVLVTGLTAILSIVYFVRMASYSAVLSWVGVFMLFVYMTALSLISRRESKYQEQIQEIDAKASSVLYQYVNGISKIRMSGAEDRALFEYMKLFTQTRELDSRRNVVSSISSVLSAASSGLFSVVLYWLLIQNGGVSIGEFIAFTSAFGMFSGAFLQVVTGALQFQLLKPSYDRCKPILNETPELDESKELPGDLSGELEINNVTFSYSPDSPVVLDNVSLHISAGEYIGIVGPSGCGKSTLLKLLLGFEVPNTGKIYYDGKDVESLDKRELRKKIGVVLQDGKLIAGSIFENITITSPKSTLNDAQRVIREIGLENDVKDMPMGLHTVLSENCGTISGGQQQRILIARAIISKPGILFFDEATSALDNITQSMVCESLDSMNATRLVIAHRLSTIINCDRIIVMNAGKIAEQGTYQELMDAKGLFYELASRQIS